MVYGRLLFNNIKEYTPKWFKTVPYSQVTKPTFKKLPQRVSLFNRSFVTKSLWRGLRNTFGQYAWSWSLLIFGISFVWFHALYHPYLAAYRYNNENRTYAKAYGVEKAYKKKKQQQELLAEEMQAAGIQNIEQVEEPIQNTVLQSQQRNLSEQDQEQLRKKQKLTALVQKIMKQQQKKNRKAPAKPVSDDE